MDDDRPRRPGRTTDARASALRPVVVVGLLGEAALVVLVVVAAAS